MDNQVSEPKNKLSATGMMLRNVSGIGLLIVILVPFIDSNSLLKDLLVSLFGISIMIIGISETVKRYRYLLIILGTVALCIGLSTVFSKMY